MANSRYDVEIRGDNKGLSAAVNQSMEDLNKLDSVASGLFSNLTGPMNDLKGHLGTIQSMSPALRGLGAAGLVAGAGLAAMHRTAEIAKDLNEISTNTGVSIEMLQQLQKEFKATGMEADKFGDINKDAMDKLGDSFREGGGGIADDLEKWGISLKSLTKYAGDAEGGIKAVVDVFYQMKQAGKSQAEIVNAMESLASDSSHLISQLENHANAQDALNAINGQAVSITEEVSDKVIEFDKNMAQLSQNVDTAAVYIGGPLIESMNDLWEFMNKDWTATDYMTILATLAAGTELGNALELQSMVDGTAAAKKEKETTDRFLKNSKREGERRLNQLKSQIETEARLKQKADEDQQKELDKQQKAAAKAQAERDKAAKEAQAAFDKMMAERKAALASLSTIDVAIIAQEARTFVSQSQQMQTALSTLQDLRDIDIISQEQYTQRKAMLLQNSSNEFKDALEKDPQNLGIITQSMNQMYEVQLQELKIKRDQGVIDQKAYNEQMEIAEQDHQSRMAAIQSTDASQVNMQNLSAIGFATDEEEMALQQEKLRQQFELFNDQNKSMYESGLLDHEEFLQQKQRLDQAYAVKSQSISLLETKTRVGMYNDMAQGMAGIMAGIAGENSKAAQAAFAISKGTAIAQGMLNAYESSTAAMAKYPGPMGYALAASNYAAVLGQVMSMKSISPTGMAHDGISEIPNEGTWLLDGGERVVDQRTNGDLKDFLADNKQGGEQVIDASMTINGNVTDQRWFAEQLKKHQQNITSIVRDGNRRKM